MARITFLQAENLADKTSVGCAEVGISIARGDLGSFWLESYCFWWLCKDIFGSVSMEGSVKEPTLLILLLLILLFCDDGILLEFKECVVLVPAAASTIEFCRS